MGQGSSGSENKRLYISRDSILIGPVAWVMRSDVDFILENYFDSAFKQFRAFGFLAKTMNDFNVWNVRYTDDDNDGFEPISFKTMEPIFIITFAGLSLSIILFVVELMVYRVKNLYVKHPHIDPNILP